jgi:hypothetical protein
MRIIGCDLHARQQTLAMLDTISGEVVNRTLMHEGNEVREFYSQLPHPVLVGIEAIGPMQWFLDYPEFCRRGQKQSGDACAGMLETRFGANSHRPVD